MRSRSLLRDLLRLFGPRGCQPSEDCGPHPAVLYASPCVGGAVSSRGRPVLHSVCFSPLKQLHSAPRANPRGGRGVQDASGDRRIGFVPGRGRGFPRVPNQAALRAGPPAAVGSGARDQCDPSSDSTCPAKPPHLFRTDAFSLQGEVSQRSSSERPFALSCL